MNSFINTVYYQVKPLIPRALQIWLRSKVIARKRARYASVWPILEKAGKMPEEWPGWPEEKRFAFVLTHDVEKGGGQAKCLELARVERELGFRSSFNFVPERYDVSRELRTELQKMGFEVGVHGLNHDGKLFQSYEIFRKRAAKINRYLREWNAVGFRAPAMHHNLDWIHELDLQYDLSTFDTDPFEPQSDGVETIFPFWVSANDGERGYVELPYTLVQDFTLFILMKQDNIDIWKQKLDWIAEKRGMALVNVHPDYISFNGTPGLEEFRVDYYKELLHYVRHSYRAQYWHALPTQVAQYVSQIRQDEINKRMAL